MNQLPTKHLTVSYLLELPGKRFSYGSPFTEDIDPDTLNSCLQLQGI